MSLTARLLVIVLECVLIVLGLRAMAVTYSAFHDHVEKNKHTVLIQTNQALIALLIAE